MKKYSYSVGLFFLAAALGVAAYSTTNKNFFPIRRSEASSYTLVLNGSNNSFLPGSRNSGTSTEANSPRTSEGNPIIFKYTNAMKKSGNTGVLYSSGTLANVTALSGITSICVVYTNGQLQLSLGNAVDTYNSTTTM